MLGAALLGVSSPATAGKKKPPPPPQEHAHPSGAFTIHVPEGWAVGPSKADPNTLQAVGQGVVVRFVYRPGDVGYDAFHGICITERLSGKPGEAPATRYEYDYVDGAYGDRRSLDSAFFVDYDEEVMGHRKWRQRNLTVVGGGDSLCIVAFAPVAVWNKSSAARTALEAVVQNVTFRQ